MTEDDKRPYQIQADADRARYLEEMQSYVPPPTVEVAAPGKKPKKDPNAPKKPMSGFMIFAAERRPLVKQANPGMSFGDIAKVVGREWKELSDVEKEPFAAKSEAAKARYKLEKEAYDRKTASALAAQAAVAAAQAAAAEEEETSSEEEEDSDEEESDGSSDEESVNPY